MFKRRQQPSLIEKISGFFWPSIGWKRSSKYVGHRVARLKGSPYSIAAGFACGAAISFTPFVGLHLAGGAFLAWLIRGNLLAAWIGTIVGNPWTFPFIWSGTYKLGLAMGFGRELNETHVDFADFFTQLLEAIKSFDLSFIADTAWPVLYPMMIGGTPCSIIAWPIFFFPVKYMIEKSQTRRIKRHAEAKRSRFVKAVKDDTEK